MCVGWVWVWVCWWGWICRDCSSSGCGGGGGVGGSVMTAAGIWLSPMQSPILLCLLLA